ncbi:MAG: lipocalin family protein [Candidatus Edwardsbacteria bacterium]|jgi:apolipoprotein D and lipocalin family protein|nr:lipocalin family protein [Candidatus Edwardsbacteria bacterium]
MKQALVTLVGLFIMGHAMSAEQKTLQVVPQVDLARYLGKWYEIATIPMRFQKGCTGVTATYTLRPDGDITVLNECRKDSLAGKYKSVTGKAWVVDTATNAKLKVRFFWPFSGDYWVIELDSTDYQYAVVGHPNRKYLWILSRRPQMDGARYEDLLARIRDVHGYDLSGIKKTPQPAE